jgi:hypothetical protein
MGRRKFSEVVLVFLFNDHRNADNAGFETLSALALPQFNEQRHNIRYQIGNAAWPFGSENGKKGSQK